MTDKNTIEALDSLGQPNGGHSKKGSGTKKGTHGKADTRNMKISSMVWRIVRGDVLGGETMKKQVNAILLIGLYALIMIFMRYQVETLQKDKEATLKRINYLKEHKIQMQRQYQESIKISHIAKELEGTGVGIISGPPYEIEMERQGW